MDDNNYGNNDQNTGGADNQYGSYQNSQNTQGTDGQYSGYQNNQANGQYGGYQNNQANGQYGGYQNNQANSQYGGYQNNQANGQYGGYQNNQAGGQYGNYQDHTAQMPPYPAPIVNNSVGEKANGLQVAGLVCGILAICACCCYGVVSIVLGVAGLICSITGNNRGKKNGVGTAGIVCSVIGLVLGIASLIYYIWAFAYLDEIGYFDEILKEFYR